MCQVLMSTDTSVLGDRRQPVFFMYWQLQSSMLTPLWRQSSSRTCNVLCLFLMKISRLLKQLCSCSSLTASRQAVTASL